MDVLERHVLHPDGLRHRERLIERELAHRVRRDPDLQRRRGRPVFPPALPVRAPNAGTAMAAAAEPRNARRVCFRPSIARLRPSSVRSRVHVHVGQGREPCSTSAPTALSAESCAQARRVAVWPQRRMLFYLHVAPWLDRAGHLFHRRWCLRHARGGRTDDHVGVGARRGDPREQAVPPAGLSAGAPAGSKVQVMKQAEAERRGLTPHDCRTPAEPQRAAAAAANASTVYVQASDKQYHACGCKRPKRAPRRRRSRRPRRALALSRLQAAGPSAREVDRRVPGRTVRASREIRRDTPCKRRAHRVHSRAHPGSDAADAGFISGLRCAHVSTHNWAYAISPGLSLALVAIGCPDPNPPRSVTGR